MRKLFRAIINIVLFPFRLMGRFFRSIYRKFVQIKNNIREFFKDEPEDTPLGDAFAKTVQNPGEIFFHLNVLRKHIFRALIAIVLFTALCFTFAQPILNFLAQPAGGLASLVAIDVTEPLSVLMRISLLFGFTLAFPYTVFEIYLFAAPGLSIKARKFGLIAIPVVVLFFLLGMAFAYYIMLPVAVPFLTSILSIPVQPRPSTYFNFATSVMFWLGVAFEFPIVIYILASLGMIKAANLKTHWRIAVVVIAFVAAMITPTVDPVNMGIIMAPLFILYLFSIFLASLAERSRNKRQIVGT